MSQTAHLMDVRSGVLGKVDRVERNANAVLIASYREGANSMMKMAPL